ncbi:myogenesis-regulating glycosidase-like [Tachypleus tridentatus]|uniref:myogenesis-regulating glycosidase-like n=1 Tax=Tachypleus tridentatus TaxID=6853 RepID=UPI003FD69F16
MLFMLLCNIVALVTFTVLSYQQDLMELSTGESIRFHKIKRVLHLLGHDNKIHLAGNLGLGIPSDLHPLDCHLLHSDNAQNICVEWKYRARLHIDYWHEERLNCYNLKWRSLAPDTYLKDCYSLSEAYWFGIGEIYKTSFPFSNISLPLQPFITGNAYQNQLGPVLERYWLSSEGVSIRVDPEIPLYFSVNISGNEKLCLETQFNSIPFDSTRTKLPLLQYTICKEDNIVLAHLHAITKFHLKTPSTSNVTVYKSPLWSTEPKLNAHLTNESLLNYASHIEEHGFEPGFIVLHSNWEKHKGDFEFHPNFAENPSEVINKLHSKRFRLLLAIHPFVCVESSVFSKGVKRSYFISSSKWNVPLLYPWKGSVCAIIDISNKKAADWFINRLKELKQKYGIDGFIFVGEYSSSPPRSYNHLGKLISPDYLLTEFLRLTHEFELVSGASVGFQTRNVNVFVKVSPRTSTWDSSKGIASVLPTVLTLELLGYAIVNPGAVGGDMLRTVNNTKPERELYIRWLQLAAFMPVWEFSFLPGDYDLEVVKVAKVMYVIREQKVLPIINRCIKEYEESGTPVLRPLWWMEPREPNAYVCNTEFSVGAEIIVAPVLEKGKNNLDIYLPKGWWRDEITTEILRGSKWLYNYSVPLDKVAYFTRSNPPS